MDEVKTDDQKKKSKIGQLLANVRLHWNEPSKGNYMSYKEILSYAGGGIGVKFLAVMATNMILSTTNVLIGNTIGIKPMDMYVLYVLSVLSNIPLSGIRANIIDNTRSKEGKYRPYIIKTGIPSALITILFVWFPYDKLDAVVGSGMIFGRTKVYVATCVVVLLLNFGQQFFYNFFYEAYDNLLHVLSPNSQERTDVASIKGVVYSLAPSVLGLVMPLGAQLFTNDNMYDIRLYRYIYPPLCILSIGLCILIYANTKEKIVQAKTHVIQIKFMDSMREVVRNKYFWIIALAGWLGFLESAVNTILQWLYNYGGICTGSQYSLITLFCQNAGLVGMLLAPFCIRKWGKRGVLIMTNVFNVVFILIMYPFINVLVILVVCFWMNALMNAFAQILTPTIQADIRDYQQYVSGERIDGMFSTITALGGIITLATSSVLPMIYERFGINETIARTVMNDSAVMNRVMDNGAVVGDVIRDAIANGTTDISYFSLYDPDILSAMLRVLVLVSALGAVINVIPYFFYDLTELKQQGIIKVLKIRAFFEDFGNNTLSDHDLVEVVEMVDSANTLSNEEVVPVSKDKIKSVSKDAIKQAKASKDKEIALSGAKDEYKKAKAEAKNAYKQNKDKKAYKETLAKAEETYKAAVLKINEEHQAALAKATDDYKQAKAQAKQEYKQAQKHNLEIQLAPFVLKEMRRFENELGQLQVANAKKIADMGLGGLETVTIAELKDELKKAKALPKKTEEEKEIRQYAINFSRTRLTARKYQKKYYDGKDTIKLPDDSNLNELFRIEEVYDTQEDELYKELYKAKEDNDKERVKKLNGDLKELKNKIKKLNKDIRDEQNKRVFYNRSAKPWVDAVKLLKQAENYGHFSEIQALYSAAKERVVALEMD